MPHRMQDFSLMPNPIIDDRTLDFLLYDVLDAERITQLPRFTLHPEGQCPELSLRPVQ